jgi:hypothetical protein
VTTWFQAFQIQLVPGTWGAVGGAAHIRRRRARAQSILGIIFLKPFCVILQFCRFFHRYGGSVKYLETAG